MQEICFDTGIEEFRINGRGALCFNPTDPNLYRRYQAFAAGLPDMVEEWKKAVAPDGGNGTDDERAGEILDAAGRIDAEIKARFGEVFGGDNDFDALFEGVNILAVTAGGGTVIGNLMDALLPVLERAAEKRTAALKGEAGDAVQKAKANRAARRAKTPEA